MSDSWYKVDNVAKVFLATAAHRLTRQVFVPPAAPAPMI
jgi:hypothetical protein